MAARCQRGLHYVVLVQPTLHTPSRTRPPGFCFHQTMAATPARSAFAQLGWMTSVGARTQALPIKKARRRPGELGRCATTDYPPPPATALRHHPPPNPVPPPVALRIRYRWRSAIGRSWLWCTTSIRKLSQPTLTAPWQRAAQPPSAQVSNTPGHYSISVSSSWLFNLVLHVRTRSNPTPQLELLTHLRNNLGSRPPLVQAVLRCGSVATAATAGPASTRS